MSLETVIAFAPLAITAIGGTVTVVFVVLTEINLRKFEKLRRGKDV